MNCWIHEESGGTRWGFKVTDVLYRGKSAYQSIAIVETESFGRVLFLDDIVMLSERWEFVYHDMIAHVPLFVHPSPQNVLIIGGGDGGTAREVLRHPEVEHLDMVEIDGEVVEASRRYLPFTASSLADPRLSLTIGDGLEFVRGAKRRYQVIIVDSTDPAGPSEGLFGEAFYRDVNEALTDDGIVVAQSESPAAVPALFGAYVKIVRGIFPVSLPYLYHTPDYPTGLWSFTFSSKRFHPLNDFRPERVRASGLDTRYYNERIHLSAFDLPSFVNEHLK